MQAQILMLVPIVLNTATLNATDEPPLQRYKAKHPEVVAYKAAEYGQMRVAQTIVNDKSLQETTAGTRKLPGALPTDSPVTELPGTKDDVVVEPGSQKKGVMPTPVQLQKTRTGCIKKVIVVPGKTVSEQKQEQEELNPRPTASVYGGPGGPALAAKSPPKPGAVRDYLLDKLKPEIFDEGFMRSGKVERIWHIPGEQPAEKAIPDSTL